MTDEILYAAVLDADNHVLAARAVASVTLWCRTAGVDAGARLTPEQAAGLGLALLTGDLDAAATLSAAGDPDTMVELALRLLAPHGAALAARRAELRLLAAAPPGVTH